MSAHALLLATTVLAAADLRWEDVARAIDAHPTVRAAEARVEEARGGLCAARTPPNPELALSGGREGQNPGEPRWEAEASLDLSWLPTAPGRAGQARAGLAEAEAEARAARLAVGDELRALFWGLIRDEALLASLRDSAAEAEALLGLTRRRVDAGEVRAADAARAAVELARARTALAAADGEARTRRATLARQVPDLQGDFSADGDLRALPSLPDLAATLARLRAADPRVAAAEARAAGAAAAQREARAGLVPALSAGVYAGQEGGLDLRGALVGAEVPLWDWDQGRLRAASAARVAQDADLAAAILAVEAEGAAAWNACSAERARALAFDGEVVAPTRAALAAMEASYRAGEIGLLDLLDARRVLAEARHEALDAWLEARLACGALAARIGEEGP